MKEKKKVRKNQTTWKNTLLQWKFEEGNKVSIKLKQKQDLNNHFKEKHEGEMQGIKRRRTKKLKKAYEEGTTHDTTKEGMK